MASYHLSVKTVRRSQGRSATAAAACRIRCERGGRVHDYGCKGGVEATLLIVPEHAPKWVEDRERLVERYGVAADVAIHAPHREGDQRNWHAHVLATTRELGPEGLGAKTRVLDVARTGGPEIERMREAWAGLQNEARALRERVAELQSEVRERAELARERYALAREEGLGQVGAGLAALRAAAERDRERARERGTEPEDLRERLRAILGRQGEREAERGVERGLEQGPEREAGLEQERDRAPEDGRSLTERLRAALDGARSAPPGRELRTEAEEQAAERERRRELGRGRSLGRDLDDGLDL